MEEFLFGSVVTLCINMNQDSMCLWGLWCVAQGTFELVVQASVGIIVLCFSHSVKCSLVPTLPGFFQYISPGTQPPHRKSVVNVQNLLFHNNENSIDAYRYSIILPEQNKYFEQFWSLSYGK